MFKFIKPFPRFFFSIKKEFDIERFLANKKNLNQKNYYVVCEGRKTGIFLTWKETEKNISGFSGAVFKKFPTISEAVDFYKSNGKASFSDLPDPTTIIPEGKKVIPIYCDGSALSNGSINARGGIGIVFGHKEYSEIVPSSYYKEKVTNNIAELYAIKRVLEIIEAENNDENFYKIFTDSQYAINSISKWDRLNSTDPKLKNLEIIKPICRKYESLKYKCVLIYVKGHDVSEGNRKADELAKRLNL